MSSEEATQLSQGDPYPCLDFPESSSHGSAADSSLVEAYLTGKAEAHVHLRVVGIAGEPDATDLCLVWKAAGGCNACYEADETALGRFVNVLSLTADGMYLVRNAVLVDVSEGIQERAAPSSVRRCGRAASI